jgi:hypothetical protein
MKNGGASTPSADLDRMKPEGLSINLQGLKSNLLVVRFQPFFAADSPQQLDTSLHYAPLEG